MKKKNTSKAAAASGLFGAPDKPTAEKPSAQSRTTRKKQPSQTQDVDSPAKHVNAPAADYVPEKEVSTGVVNFADQRDLFQWLKASFTVTLDKPSNSSMFSKAGLVARYIDGLQRKAEAMRAEAPCAREAGEMITADQIAGIISDRLKAGHDSGKLTGADAKGLTATLRDLLPDLFRTDTDADKPDPCAVMAYLCSFSGANGKDIIKDMGGAEFVAAQLSEILGVPVTLGSV